MRNPKRPIEIKLRTNVKFCFKNHPFLNTFKEIIANFAPTNETELPIDPDYVSAS